MSSQTTATATKKKNVTVQTILEDFRNLDPSLYTHCADALKNDEAAMNVFSELNSRLGFVPEAERSLTCESKTSSNNNNAVVVFTDLLGIVNHGYSLTWCKSIFAYLGPTAKDTVSLRCYCKLFSKALKPLPCWTSFPHPKYSTLNKLFGRFNEVSRSGSTNVPKVLLIENGIHDEVGNVVYIRVPISIIGESREHCIFMGGLQMNGNEEDDVNVSNLTLCDSKSSGVYGCNGASFHLDNVSVENSGNSGVFVFGTKRSTMKNCNVSHSKWSGLYVQGGGLMTIDGKDTTIHHNCTRGDSDDYGLYTHDSSSSIHLASSLTIETISKNNGGGGNYGGKGTIKTNRSKEQIMSCVDEQGRLRVTPGASSLENAVYEAQQNGIIEIFLLDGEHDEKGGSVIIDYSVSIVGESREHCIVMGGLLMKGKREYDVNVSNLTLRDSKSSGVYGCNGASFHLDNVSVENSGNSGVFVYTLRCFSTKRSTMKNCNVSHSKGSGLLVENGGLMTIDGNGTTIHHNCTNGDSRFYGLSTRSSSSIHLASPLTIETISKNNGGGGNHGGRGTIAIVDNEGTIIETIQEATEDDSEGDN